MYGMPGTPHAPTDAIESISIETADNGWVIHVRKSGMARDEKYVCDSHQKYVEAMEKIMKRQAIRVGGDGSMTAG